MQYFKIISKSPENVILTNVVVAVSYYILTCGRQNSMYRFALKLVSFEFKSKDEEDKNAFTFLKNDKP